MHICMYICYFVLVSVVLSVRFSVVVFSVSVFAYELVPSGNERLCKNKSIEQQQRRRKTEENATKENSAGERE